MGFFLGFIFGAAAGTYYWNREACEQACEKWNRRRFKYWEESSKGPNEKSYQLENEDYKVIFNLIQKNPPKPKSE